MSSSLPVFSRSKIPAGKLVEGAKKTPVKRTKNGDEIGVPWTGEEGISKTTDEITAAQSVAPPSSRPQVIPERERAFFGKRRQDTNDKSAANYPFTNDLTNER